MIDDSKAARFRPLRNAATQVVLFLHYSGMRPNPHPQPSRALNILEFESPEARAEFDRAMGSFIDSHFRQHPIELLLPSRMRRPIDCGPIVPLTSDGASSPPPWIEWILLFVLPSKRSDSILGDFQERYEKVLKRHGGTRAAFWYGCHACRMVGSYVIPRALGLSWVVELFKKFIG